MAYAPDYLTNADRVANRLWRRRDSMFLHKQYNPAFPVLSFAEDILVRQIDGDEES